MKSLILFSIVGFIFVHTSYLYASNYNNKILLRKNVENIIILGDVDYRINDSDLVYKHYDIGVRMPFLYEKWFGAIKYRYIYKKKNNRWDLLEKRPQLQIERKFNTTYLEYHIRFRQEYRMRENKDNASRSRVLVCLKSKEELLYVKPFISNEMFYDFNVSRYNLNRFDLGIALPNIFYFTPYISYRHKSSYDIAEHSWESENIILFKMAVRW